MLGEAERHEGRAALVRDAVAGEQPAFQQGVHNGSIAAAGAQHRMPHTVRVQQCRELKDVLFIAEHGVSPMKSAGAGCSSSPASPAIRTLRRTPAPGRPRVQRHSIRKHLHATQVHIKLRARGGIQHPEKPAVVAARRGFHACNQLARRIRGAPADRRGGVQRREHTGRFVPAGSVNRKSVRRCAKCPAGKRAGRPPAPPMRNGPGIRE